MSAQTRRLFAEIMRRDPVDLGLACLLVAAETDPALDVMAHLARLDALAEAARPLVSVPATDVPRTTDSSRVTDSSMTIDSSSTAPATSGGALADGMLAADPHVLAEGLAAALGKQEGFGGTASDYSDPRASLLPEVLRRRHGLPILLSVVWLEVARRLGIPSYPVGLPGHVLVGIGRPGAAVLVDPYAGGRIVTVHEAAQMVRSAGVAFTRSQLAPMTPVDLVTRVLTNIRLLAGRSGKTRTRLWAVEVSMLLPHRPAGLRRERGELLVQLGDFAGGADELEAFAAAVAPAEPAAAEAARGSARLARARLN